jgi:hypothetical protein
MAGGFSLDGVDWSGVEPILVYEFGMGLTAVDLLVGVAVAGSLAATACRSPLVALCIWAAFALVAAAAGDTFGA